MTGELRRRLRVLFKFGLLVCLPITGYLWAMTATSAASPAAIVMTILSVVMALGAEGLASIAESELAQLRSQAEGEVKQWNSDIAVRDEKIRQMDRVIETLSNQNHDLRGKLVSIHGEMHRAAREEADADTPATTEPDTPAAGIADLTSLRQRR